ncbi:MAG: type II toxin-antitoxin system HicA family toxin [Bacteroidales bacterium]|nr:type II toxin-antitoxin system HicA family toxin [Bacteroidales bacterium]MCD4789376.1 type II toxin-antitoxin system HicA family toxin [Bacteroidales bacterium]
MSKKEKLIERFLRMPTDFHFNEIVKLLSYYDFHPVKKGKTSGSRVKFENSTGVPILLHKPHPNGIMKMYQLKQIKEILEL